MPATRPTPFGRRLRHLRRVRGLSQLQLATAADVSPRHISFIETGRSRPSADMVLRLADTLEVSLRGQNELLAVAGFSPAYPEHDLAARDMAPVRRVVDAMLRQHEPFPGFAIDRHWDVVATNAAAQKLFPAAADGSPNLVEAFLGPGVFRTMVENYAEVVHVTLTRLRREAAADPDDEALSDLLVRAEQLAADVPEPEGVDLDAPVIFSRFRVGDARISTVSTIASFQGAREVTAQELRIELIFPADDASEAMLRQIAQL